MRGKEGDELGLGQTIRITPAYAGKSKSLPSLHIGSRDHPRVCGEKPQNQKTPPQLIGSPPRVRGKVSAGKILLHDGGITPACAGKSYPPKRCAFDGGDHPRVCGEKQGLIARGDVHPGSPPRVRGKEHTDETPKGNLRITPACAGKSAMM